MVVWRYRMTNGPFENVKFGKLKTLNIVPKSQEVQVKRTFIGRENQQITIAFHYIDSYNEPQ